MKLGRCLYASRKPNKWPQKELESVVNTVRNKRLERWPNNWVTHHGNARAHEHLRFVRLCSVQTYFEKSKANFAKIHEGRRRRFPTELITSSGVAAVASRKSIGTHCAVM